MGLYRIVEDNLEQRLGADRSAAIGSLLEALGRVAGDFDPATPSSALANAVAKIEQALHGYTPAQLAEDEIERQARLLMRFIELVHTEYKDGVRNGEISIPMEYHEARLFRDRAEMLFGDLQGALMARSPEQTERLREMIAEMQDIIEAKGPVPRIKELSGQGAELVGRVLNIEADARGHRVAFQILPGILDEIVMLAGAGDYPAADLKRLDAYAFFDPDIEQRLFPRSPGLSLALESRFWEGTAERPGLQRLLETRAPAGLLSAEVAQTKAQLEQVREILDTKLGATAAFVQSLAIVLREGLEAILVIAILLGALRAMGTRGYASYIWGGVSLGIAASFATW